MGEEDQEEERCKRQKTLIPKGKEKIEVEDDDDDDDDRTCGICLSDAGRSVRGRIDSCDHRFCFLCIMEWARVETRCPMCKQRFCSIRRPSSAGSGRLVPVPERNQVYRPHGNESVAPFDPYADVACSECHTSVDEELLLLCDLCDSASHTYCIGLGATVPEGDWYCRDCAILRTEHSKNQTDSESSIDDSYNRLRAVTASVPRRSNIEIVSHGFDSSRGSLAEPPPSQERNGGRPPPRRNSISQRESRGPAVPVGESISSVQTIIEQSARTLQRSRNVQSHIRVLRENWNALRSGSLAFSSRNIDSSSKGGVERKKAVRVISDTARHPDSTSVHNKLSVDFTAPRKTIQSADPEDVSKAWMNMKIAKSIQGDRRGALSSHSLNFSDNKPRLSVSNGHTTPPCAMTGHTEAVEFSSFSLVEKHKFPYQKEKVDEHRSKNMQSNQSGHSKSPPLRYMKSPVDAHGSKNMQKNQSGHSKNPPLGYMKSPSFKQDSSSLQEGICNGKKRHSPLQLHIELATQCGEITLNRQCSRIPSVSGISSLVALNPNDSSSCKVEPGKGKKEVARADGNSIRSKGNDNNSAKGDIQSLVKLNLKLLNGDRSLDANKFKEVARLATHTILAACGLENSMSIRLTASPICKHSEQVRELRKSNLMPNCCRECFFSYVKDVVNSILLEKTPREGC
ncbi:PHD and RING finger domain-containing protein-like [Iris pallida]|uniref:PHD and RING finger domain-containing protein-like n=1 Tax=Iris pallida TaxID=29817 RepID=A0AAX6ITJ2_IRIPA|nr:PHD and RING finger domain-containing protein-like [Iris pallida]